MDYFSHETMASKDDSIVQLRLSCGGGAVDAYWYCIESIYREERPLCIRNAGALQAHCYFLHVDETTLKGWLEAMISIGLLVELDDGSLTSNHAEAEIKNYRKRSKSAAKAAKIRWEKANSGSNADAKRTHSKRKANAGNNASDRNPIISISNNTNTNNASGAGFDDAAPEAKIKCPDCQSRDIFFDATQGVFSCPACGKTFQPEVFR